MADDVRPLAHDPTARAILDRATVTEKIALLHQHEPAIGRLGLAPFHTGTEGLHGLSWLGVATVFPQPVGLAASWDPALLAEVGDAVADEVRAKHAADPSVSLNVWAPVVNSLRHPLWGRTEEGYSEDPDLTAALATGFCTGLRGTHTTVWKTVPTLKHFLAYGNETDRAVTSSHLPPQALREYEMPAFAGPLASATVGAVMPSYNLVNGRPSHVSGELIDDLRGYAPHSIAVVSDAQAPSNLVDGEYYFGDHVEAHAAALRAGVDSFTENSENSGPTIERLIHALAQGAISENDIDRAVLRMLQLRERTGEFSGVDEWAEARIDTPRHRRLARRAASRGVVVLANEGRVLPLAPPSAPPLSLAAPAVIAVVGPFADHAVQDWYSGTPPYQSTLAEALAERYPEAEIVVADGADRVALRSLTHDRFVRADTGGRLAAEATTPNESTHLDVTDWGDGVLTLRSLVTGKLLTGEDWIVRADADRVGGWVAMQTFRIAPRESRAMGEGGAVSLQHIASGKWLRVQHGTFAVVADGSADSAECFELVGIHSAESVIAEACGRADVSIVTVGNDPHIAGRETEDRPRLTLPDSMRAIWRAAHGGKGRTVLTVVSSYPYAIADEAAQADAVVWTSHAGQELGHGVVDVLSGDVEPSGRLAQTWWRDAADAGDLLEYDVVGAGMTYRYQDAEALFALGHGLSYTTVDYAGIHLSRATAEAPPITTTHAPARAAGSLGSLGSFGSFAGRAAGDGAGEIVATVTVRNTGERSVDELVAVYALSPDAAVRAPAIPVPLRRLAGWARVHLAAGETRDVEIAVPLGIFAVWDAGLDGDTSTPGAFRVQPAVYRLASGASADRLDVSADIAITGADAGARRVDSLRAFGFHAHENLVTSDYTRTAGHSVEVAAAFDAGWARFDRVDMTGVTAVRAEVARRAHSSLVPAEIRLEVRASGSTDWRPLGEWAGIDDRGRYDWTTLALEVDIAALPLDGAGDLRLSLRGAARVATLHLVR